VTYPFLCATSYEMDPHRGGMASWPPPAVEVGGIVSIERETFFVCDHWTTWDPTIIEDERPEWWATCHPPRGLAELVLEVAS
jgi:hypothetical protein